MKAPVSKIYRLPAATVHGVFLAGYSDSGLCELDFPGSGSTRGSRPNDMSCVPKAIQEWHRLTTRALERVLGGADPETMPPLDLSIGTTFQQQVWRTLVKIAAGGTWTYGMVAKAIGRPKAVRAVGAACGANPVPVLVPCHRVLAANQRLGGFSGGLDWKKKLLRAEKSWPPAKP
jgi:O-6-methylguanine DNA methyltransferase